MITSFRDPETERLWQTGKSRCLPPDLHRRAFKKLAILNASLALDNLKVPPGNHLETLSGDRAGQHSIRITAFESQHSNQRSVPRVLRVASGQGLRCRDCGLSLEREHAAAIQFAVLRGSVNRSKVMADSNKKIFAVHPGEILKTEFMEPMGISAYALAKALHFPGIYEVVRGQRAISADTALRLGKYFALPAQFWLNLQNDYDLRLAKRSSALNRIRPRTAFSRSATSSAC